MTETILLVDDDRLILQMCKDALEKAGYQTMCLQEGRALAAAVASSRPSLILLDIMMPGTDGLTLCRQLRSGPDAFRGPIVIFSAKHYETDKRIHVSPFMSMDQEYTWLFSEPRGRVYVRMDVHEAGMRPFHATLAARRVELTPRTLRAALVRYPLMPAKVISLIHLQALRLWLKRVPFFRKPPFVPGRGTVKP